MKFSEDNPGEGFVITAYDGGSVRIAGNDYTSSLILCADRLIEDWPLACIDDLCEQHFAAIVELEPELVLLGTGNRLVFPPVQVYASLIQRNIGIEIMNTPAACRTYNVLMAEGRKVTAGLIID
jgi:uncharacterized protein